MEESKERSQQVGAGHGRDEEATSNVEESENVKARRETGSPTETSSPGPSPDSAFGGGRADGSETGGPM